MQAVDKHFDFPQGPCLCSSVALFQPMTHAEATSSLAPTASALIRTGSVMEMMTAKILVMKMDVVRTRHESHQES